mgnify:CR=1 FL=1
MSFPNTACFDAADTSTADKKTAAKTACMAEAKAEFKKLGGDDTKYEKEVKKAAGKKAQSLMATCLEDIVATTSDDDKKVVKKCDLLCPFCFCFCSFNNSAAT